MGGGSWTSDDWDKFSTTKVSGKSTTGIYTATKMDPNLDPKGVKIRESRDSEDNPNSNAVIVAEDVTGSMDMVLDSMIRTCLPTFVTELYNRKPISDPHLMFMGIGDVRAGDLGPLQVTQFEADIRIAEQLSKIWLEGKGGGNRFESYILAWFFAAMHTSIDCFEKRKRKGYLFTIGDEEVTPDLTPDEIERVMGSKEISQPITAQELLTLVGRSYEVFHIMIAQGDYFHRAGDRVVKSWTQMLGQRALLLTDHTKVSELIVSTIQLNEGSNVDEVMDSWDGSTSMVVRTGLANFASSLPSTNVAPSEVVVFD